MYLRTVTTLPKFSIRKQYRTQFPLVPKLIIVAFLAVFVLPSEALAFETTLPAAPAPTFVAPVTIEDHVPDFFVVLPTESYMTSVAVVAVPSANTEIAKWPKAVPVRRLASARLAARPIQPLDIPVVLEGEASYYSRAGCLGCDSQMIMANGQPLNDGALTMAIGADKKHLVGRRATVTNLVTGASVDVTITDTGGFYQAKYGHRVADLTIATKQAIGINGGLGQVRVEVK